MRTTPWKVKRRLTRASNVKRVRTCGNANPGSTYGSAGMLFTGMYAPKWDGPLCEGRPEDVNRLVPPYRVTHH